MLIEFGGNPAPSSVESVFFCWGGTWWQITSKHLPIRHRLILTPFSTAIKISEPQWQLEETFVFWLKMHPVLRVYVFSQNDHFTFGQGREKIGSLRQEPCGPRWMCLRKCDECFPERKFIIHNKNPPTG